jgi:hypothetical protein
MTKRPEQEKSEREPVDAHPRRIRTSVSNDAEIVVNIEYTKPGTALNDYLRKEQARALLDLVADHAQKLDESGDTER